MKDSNLRQMNLSNSTATNRNSKPVRTTMWLASQNGLQPTTTVRIKHVTQPPTSTPTRTPPQPKAQHSNSNTSIARQREADYTTGSLEITRAATTEPTLTLGLITNRESTTIELTPQQALQVADTLQTTATEIVAAELPKTPTDTH